MSISKKIADFLSLFMSSPNNSQEDLYSEDLRFSKRGLEIWLHYREVREDFIALHMTHNINWASDKYCEKIILVEAKYTSVERPSICRSSALSQSW